MRWNRAPIVVPPNYFPNVTSFGTTRKFSLHKKSFVWTVWSSLECFLIIFEKKHFQKYFPFRWKKVVSESSRSLAAKVQNMRHWRCSREKQRTRWRSTRFASLTMFKRKATNDVMQYKRIRNIAVELRCCRYRSAAMWGMLKFDKRENFETLRYR